MVVDYTHLKLRAVDSNVHPLESPINVTCMLLDGGVEYPERTHAYMGRT